ncbi:hypothetical protein CC86DRAFT_34066 [Ophiobolus disseminans]|uniref:C3H1-type domain-containing protein n=1 Tax=Ophiobolus disseminans TaxID=1469910 RepID=A0A6A6ZXV4_9PLEO|nr:hypothetical protein CC86DRAFT_34066 [Ophiobolus disseminans]
MGSIHGFNLSLTSTPDRNTGSVAEPESEIASFNRRNNQFQQFDLERNRFVDELLLRLEVLTQERENAAAQRQQDVEFIQSWRTQKAKYEEWYNSARRQLSDNQFIMVLIDGDGMIFTDDFVERGEMGGRQAASQLYTAVKKYIETECVAVQPGARIVCRMYANVRGLGDVLVRKGVIEDISVFEDFVRGFTRGKALFDFVDVGAGKDRADEKIIELFKLFSRDVHCTRLLFGCSHDNGYARTLEECSDVPEVVTKTVLLEGVPFEKELVSLPYSTVKFPGIFREAKIVLQGAANPYSFGLPMTPTDTSTHTLKNYNILSGMPSRFPAPARPSGIMDSPLPSRAMLAKTTISRTPSSSTIASDGFLPALKPQSSWAAKAAAPPPPVTEMPVYHTPVREELIARNRAGQRIDPPCRSYDKAEVDRVKRLKLCNVHFLREECPYDSSCTHLHAYKATKDELSTLRLVARMAPCSNGSGCQDIKCIYGHRCPAPPHRTHPVKGTKSCIFGESCKFPPELHDIDTNVVKMLVIR